MSKVLSTACFDYAQVDKDVKGKLIALAGQAKQKHLTFRDSGMKIGEIMAEAHALLGSKMFEEWVEAETDIGTSTAYNCKNVFEAGQASPIFGQIPLSVGYILASPSTPQAAIDDVAKEVNAGAKPTVKMAKAAVKRHKPSPVKKPKKKKAAENADPNQTPPWPCLRSGGDHRWGPDEERLGKQCCLECGETEGAPELPAAKPDTPVLKLFSKLNEHMGKSVRLLDDINRLLPNEKLRKEIFDSLEVANEDIRKWKKGAKK